MPKKRYNAEEIIHKLREDAALSPAWWRPQRDSNPYGSRPECN